MTGANPLCRHIGYNVGFYTWAPESILLKMVKETHVGETVRDIVGDTRGRDGEGDTVGETARETHSERDGEGDTRGRDGEGDTRGRDG